MATGPIEDSQGKQRHKLSSQKLHNKSRNPNRVPKVGGGGGGGGGGGTVASDDSSGLNHLHLEAQNPIATTATAPASNNVSSLPRYVVFDNNKVKISLNSSSKSEVRELKRKLVTELSQVRSLKRKLEAIEIQFSSGHVDKNNSNNHDGDGDGDDDDVDNVVGNNRVETLARVNSELSHVGPALSQAFMENSNVGKVGKEKKTPNLSKSYKGLGVLEGKKSKASGGGKRDEGSGKDRYRELFKKCGDLLGMLMKHKYGWVFNMPVDVKKLKLHDYFDIIKHPMDLGTVKSRLSKNWYKSPKQFAEDVRLTFNNAMTYNEKGQDVHTMADMLLKMFEEKWAEIKAEFGFDKRSGMRNLPKPSSKRAPIHSAPAPTSSRAAVSAPNSARATTPPPPPPPHSATRTSDRPDSRTLPVGSNLKDTEISGNEGKTPVSKKHNVMDPDKKDMTYEEKQRLSTSLQDLPSDKLETVVQIIRKRNPELGQQEDEIEVDIESFDNETLWELNRFVTNYEKSMNKSQRKAESQPREEADCNIQETNWTSPTAEVPKDSEAVEKFLTTSFQGEKQGDNVSGSSSRSSSGSDSGSSSSDSDSDSSSGSGSDASI